VKVGTDEDCNTDTDDSTFKKESYSRATLSSNTQLSFDIFMVLSTLHINTEI
jgi:hypothetical protein